MPDVKVAGKTVSVTVSLDQILREVGLPNLMDSIRDSIDAEDLLSLARESLTDDEVLENFSIKDLMDYISCSQDSAGPLLRAALNVLVQSLTGSKHQRSSRYF